MGKDLKGRELGKGIVQERGGCYKARYVDQYGQRQSKRFKMLQEAKHWLAESIYLDEHSSWSIPHSITVNALFQIWIETKQKQAKKGTAVVYEQRYHEDVEPVIGSMMIVEVKPPHLDRVLNRMIDKDYRNATIAITRSLLNGLFEYAVECDVIVKVPRKLKLKSDVGKAKKKREALTIDEQVLFLKGIKGHEYELPWRFILQTGIRVGELNGLRWSDVNFKKRTVSINRTMRYVSNNHDWYSGSPKSQSGRRTIPLTEEAIKLLKNQKMKNELKVIPSEWSDNIFVGSNGTPIRADAYDSSLKALCKRLGMNPISMHILRHTFATRSIEGGMNPKYLQSIMGHSTFAVTMDVYVHTTLEELVAEIDKVSSSLFVA